MGYTVIPTIVTGDVATASWANTHLKANFAAGVPDLFTTQGDTVHATGADAAARLAKGSTGNFYRQTSTVPEWADQEDGAKLDGDHLDIDFTPTNYTPDTSPSEAADVDDLAAHLKGIDTQIGVDAQIKTGTYTGDGATAQAITGVGFQPKFLMLHAEVGNGVIPDKGELFMWNTYTATRSTSLDTGAGRGEWQIEGINSLDADGFTVDDNGADEHPNQNTVTYRYLAIG